MTTSHAKDSTFLGGRVPPEIESMSKNLKDVDQELFRKLLKGKCNFARWCRCYYLRGFYDIVTKFHSAAESKTRLVAKLKIIVEKPAALDSTF